MSIFETHVIYYRVTFWKPGFRFILLADESAVSTIHTYKKINKLKASEKEYGDQKGALSHSVRIVELNMKDCFSDKERPWTLGFLQPPQRFPLYV